jgi:hypothetical protein
LIKITTPDSFDFGDPVARLVDIHRGGVDKSWMTKSAAAGAFSDLDIKPRHGHSLIHLLALGDMEGTGYNRNGDGFPGHPMSLRGPESDWESVKTASGRIDRRSSSTWTDRINTGNDRRAATFTKHANVYKNHKNKPQHGDRIFGSVKAAVHNDRMRRVELIVELAHGKDWDDDLQKIANDEPVYWSMAARVPFDVCSVCNHKAKTRSDYCEHLDKNLGGVLEDGTKVGAINDEMTYFDISRVIRPADRIAWAMTKVAAYGNVATVGAADSAAYWNLAEPSGSELSKSIREASPLQRSNRSRVLNKAAEIEKRISLSPLNSSVVKAALGDRCALKEKIASWASSSTEKVAALTAAGVRLTYSEFSGIHGVAPDRGVDTSRLFSRCGDGVVKEAWFDVSGGRRLDTEVAALSRNLGCSTRSMESRLV